MYKIGIIGERDTVQGFMALGFSVFEAADTEAARKALHEAAATGEYAVLFLVENYAREMEEDLARYKDDTLPAVTVIPGRAGAAGYGVAQMRRAVERAVGADILFND